MGIACVTAAIEYAWTKKARHREHRVGSSDEYKLNVELCENVLVISEQIGFVCQINLNFIHVLDKKKLILDVESPHCQYQWQAKIYMNKAREKAHCSKEQQNNILKRGSSQREMFYM